MKIKKAYEASLVDPLAGINIDGLSEEVLVREKDINQIRENLRTIFGEMRRVSSETRF